MESEASSRAALAAVAALAAYEEDQVVLAAQGEAAALEVRKEASRVAHEKAEGKRRVAVNTHDEFIAMNSLHSNAEPPRPVSHSFT